jgi:hypothetical protein
VTISQKATTETTAWRAPVNYRRRNLGLEGGIFGATALRPRDNSTCGTSSWRNSRRMR